MARVYRRNLGSLSSSKMGWLRGTASLLALLPSSLLLLAGISSSPVVGAAESKASPLAKVVVSQVVRKGDILQLAKEENKRAARISDKIFDLNLQVGGTGAELEHMGGLLGHLDNLTRRSLPDVRTPEERVRDYLKREGKIVYEIANLQLKVRGLRSFQTTLSNLREELYKLREREQEIAKLSDQLRLLKNRVSVAKIAYEAAYSNNWNLTKESLLYVLGFKWF